MDYQNLHVLLHNKVYTNKDLAEITPVMFARWFREGLISHTQEKKHKTVHFSLMDILWMGLIMDLKNFGCPKKQLLKIKEYLVETKSKNKKDVSLLERSIIEILVDETLVWMVIDDSWNILVCNTDSYTDYIKEQTEANFMVFSFNKLIKENTTDFYASPEFRGFLKLSADEMEILSIVRSQNYQSIKITKKNGEVDLIEGVQRIEKKTKISEILKLGLYQDIEIKQYNGQVSYINRTVKKKLSKK